MLLWRFLKLVKNAVWRAFEHDAFGVAKGAAYSSIITFFPALVLAAGIFATAHGDLDYIHAASLLVARIMPPGTASTVRSYFESAQQRPVRILFFASLVTLWTASGVMMSWMVAFRSAYQLPKTWGIIKERLVAFGLVIMAGIPMTFATILVAFGNQIETRLTGNAGSLGPLVLLAWTGMRWVIALATSVAVMALIYHNAVPRTQRWHSVLPGAGLATAVWFPATIGFGWYVRHFAEYSLYYGSLATAIVLLVWMYIVSIIVMIGAEFNAQLYPRVVTEMPKTAAPAARLQAR
ncbi:MAG TPA: YihY/virulence factor BrkB family protein [Terriglobales bacterium]|nr:YihY/virulence factor BrkB family protein [Terriglobales bacterium]